MKYFALYPVLLLCIQAAEFPPYFNRCCGSDPDFNNCLVKSLQKAVLPWLQGHPHYNLPNLLPYRVGKVVLQDDENAYFILRNTLLHGLSSTRILSANVDWNTNTCKASYNMKALVTRFAYDLKLNGSCEVQMGTGGVILENVNMNHSFSFVKQSDGHVHINNPTLEYSVGKVTYEMENMDDATNQYLNDNFAYMHDVIKAKAAEYFSDCVTWPFVSLAEAVPLNEMSSCEDDEGGITIPPILGL